MLVKFVTHTKVVLPIWSMYRSPWSCRLWVVVVFDRLVPRQVISWSTQSNLGSTTPWLTLQNVQKHRQRVLSEGLPFIIVKLWNFHTLIKIWQSYILPSLTTTPVPPSKYWGWNTAQCSWHDQRDLLRDNQSRVDSHDPTASSFHLSNAEQGKSTRKRAVEIFHSLLCSSNVFVPRFDAEPTRTKRKFF